MNATNDPKVRTTLDGAVFTITLTDEANRNALGAQLLTELAEAFDRVDDNDQIRVAVVSNEGRVFCAGADISEQLDGDAAGIGDLAELLGRIRRSSKPFVGRIGGHAVGGGMGLAAAMDISVATSDAMFGFTEVRVGVAPAIISVICLPKMRHADAAAVFLRGNRFDAAEAVRIGLINETVPPGGLDARIEEIVADLQVGGPAALAACKRVLADVPSMGFDEALRWTSELSATLFAGAEAQEGMAAFLEKRPPVWAPRLES